MPGRSGSNIRHIRRRTVAVASKVSVFLTDAGWCSVQTKAIAKPLVNLATFPLMKADAGIINIAGIVIADADGIGTGKNHDIEDAGINSIAIY